MSEIQNRLIELEDQTLIELEILDMAKLKVEQAKRRIRIIRNRFRNTL